MTQDDNNFLITKKVKSELPHLPFSELKLKTLGKNYDLSVVIVGDREAQILNQTYRKKSYVPNVLSFPISKTSGEIFLNPRQAKREHKARNEDYRYYLALLVVHGMLHLKGMQHGSKMEDKEKRLLAQTKIQNIFS